MQPKSTIQRDHPTRWCEELIQTEALFFTQVKKKWTNSIRAVNRGQVQRESQTLKRLLNFQQAFLAGLSTLSMCFPLEYCRKGCSWRNLANTDLSLKRQTKKKISIYIMIIKGRYTSHHIQQIHVLVSQTTGLREGYVFILLSHCSNICTALHAIWTRMYHC